MQPRSKVLETGYKQGWNTRSGLESVQSSERVWWLFQRRVGKDTSIYRPRCCHRAQCYKWVGWVIMLNIYTVLLIFRALWNALCSSTDLSLLNLTTHLGQIYFTDSVIWRKKVKRLAQGYGGSHYWRGNSNVDVPDAVSCAQLTRPNLCLMHTRALAFQNWWS